MKSYAVLLAPDFRLQATLRHSPRQREEPVALLEVQGTKPRVEEMNAPARARQVQRGMTPTQAVARCPELQLISGNRGHERSAQEALIQTAGNLSPFLESTGPGIVTVELPPERTFHERDFLEKLIFPLQELGLETRVGVAHTPDLALLAARFGQPVRIITEAAAFLAPLPLAVLEPSGELGAVLDSWGIRTIGQWLALPREEICERLGQEAVELWERAVGGHARPLQLVKPPEFFAEQADLEHSIEMLEPLLFLLRRFLEQIAARLGHAYLVAGKLRLTLRFETGDPYERVFAIPQPTREVGLLFRLLHTHLENFTSAAPIVAFELAANPVRPHAEQRGLLEKGLRDPHQFAETIARLQALLGSDRVGTPRVEASRHPEAFHLEPCPAEPPPRQPGEELLIGVPCLHFRPRIPAHIILNETRPAFLYSAHGTGAIKDARGPWLLEGNWWEPRRWSREEWDVATEEGIYRLVKVEEDWFLEGIYA